MRIQMGHNNFFFIFILGEILDLPLTWQWTDLNWTNGVVESLCFYLLYWISSRRQDDTCRFQSKNVGARDTGYVRVTPRGDENALKEAVASIGPISVSMDASHETFHLYKSGLFIYFSTSVALISWSVNGYTWYFCSLNLFVFSLKISVY